LKRNIHHLTERWILEAPMKLHKTDEKRLMKILGPLE